MKYLILTICALLCACSNDDLAKDPIAAQVTIHEPLIELSTAESQSITIAFDSNMTVDISSDRSWCKPSAEHARSGEIKILVDANSGRFERSARVNISAGEVCKQVEITQPKGLYTKGMHYEIPIVFHIVYSNENSAQHNPDAKKIYNIFEKVQKLYKECGEELNFDFVLAEEDEQGNTLAEPGIHRIKQSLRRMECLKVMKDVSGDYTSLGWDPRRYLNVTIYEFSDPITIMGLSRAPYLVKPQELEGVQSLKNYIHPADLSFLYSISLNNTFLEPEDSSKYNMYDFGTTLAHEIGHYLGLAHPFSETLDSNGTQNTEDDTDYCTDTPTYNKYLYDNIVYEIFAECGGDFSAEQIEELSYRTACGDNPYQFRSTNIMDYAVGDANRFSAQQVERMRYILENCPYIPGAKSVDFETTETKSSNISDELRKWEAEISNISTQSY